MLRREMVHSWIMLAIANVYFLVQKYVSFPWDEWLMRNFPAWAAIIVVLIFFGSIAIGFISVTIGNKLNPRTFRIISGLVLISALLSKASSAEKIPFILSAATLCIFPLFLCILQKKHKAAQKNRQG